MGDPIRATVAAQKQQPGIIGKNGQETLEVKG
jgi:hypothetical protein